MTFLYDESGNVFGFTYKDAAYYYVKNLQGDIIGILNQAGEQITRYDYNAWGSPDMYDGQDFGEVGEANPLRYRSYYFDTETYMYYLNSRYYHPEYHRFISADSVLGANKDILSYNLFTYCSNNPVMFSDPSGMQSHYTTSDPGEAVGLIIGEFLIRGAIIQEFIDRFHFEPDISTEVGYEVVRAIVYMSVNFQWNINWSDLSSWIISIFFMALTGTTAMTPENAEIIKGIATNSGMVVGVLGTASDDRFTGNDMVLLNLADIASVGASLAIGAAGASIGGWPGIIAVIGLSGVVFLGRKVYENILLSKQWTAIPY